MVKLSKLFVLSMLFKALKFRILPLEPMEINSLLPLAMKAVGTLI